MTKADLIAKIAADAGISKAAAERALNAMVDGVIETVAKGGKVTIVGFGTFLASQRAARTGRNPRTGETIKIPATQVAKFKVGKAFKDAVR